MQALSAFHSRILPYVPGCSYPLMDQALVDSAIAFCDESLVIRQFVQDQITIADTNFYTIADTTHETVARVLTVKIDGTAIAPVNSDDGALAITTEPGQPVRYYTTRVDSALKVILYPTPDKQYTLSMEVAWKPLRTAAQLQDDLLNVWVEPVVEGAVARLMATPAQPFTDQMAGAAKLLSAKSGARRARIESTSGRTRVSRYVRPRPFA